MTRAAGPHRYCLMISEDVPENWRDEVPAVLDQLAAMPPA